MGLLNVKWVVAIITAIPAVYNFVNRIAIDRIVKRVRSRPHPFSTAHNFVSWKGLTDKTWSARHLPANPEFKNNQPDEKKLAHDLFTRIDESAPLICPKSTLLFPTFAQYLTDGFIRTATDDKNVKDKDTLLLRNTSNHDIDLCTLYGRTEIHTLALRELSEARPGRLKVNTDKRFKEDYSPFLFKKFKNKKPKNINLPIDIFNEDFVPRTLADHKIEIVDGFEVLDLPLGLPKLVRGLNDKKPEVRAFSKAKLLNLFAVGGDRVNSATQTSLMNTVLLREHNRLADEIAKRNNNWNDDQVFETARNIVIVEFIKIVVTDYINHIAPIKLNLKADPRAAWKAEWNRPNWITTEFSLLYRWHALIPDYITWGGKSYKAEMTFMNNIPLLAEGMAQGFIDMAAQKAGRMGAHNTTKFLVPLVEEKSILHGRVCDLDSYNAYREYTGQKAASDFDEITSNPKTVAALKKHYGHVNEVEFFTGIFCEDIVPNSPLPQTILIMVAVDAFSQALTNPLLSKQIFQRPDPDNHSEIDAFTLYGWEQISELNSLEDLVKRNLQSDVDVGKLSMTHDDWTPS